MPDQTTALPDLADLLGATQLPARDDLIRALAESVRDRREHDHPTWEDLYCLNLASWAGERMGAVLRRLADAEADNEQLRARVTELERERDGAETVTEWAVRSTNGADGAGPYSERAYAETVLADAAARGYEGEVVTRTVAYGPWHPAADGGEPDA